jgi:hypothetical protein
MIPSGFDESNDFLSQPEGMTVEECVPLCVWRGDIDNGIPVVISCWKPTQAELDEIQRTGRVWLMVWGHTMPPVAISGDYPFGEVLV